MKTVQNYLNTLCNRGEITESGKKAIGCKFAQITRAHGRRKTHKPFEHIPKFRPIIETPSTPCYGISNFYQTFGIP